ncbi:MAG TPA: outer membrane lipoprotein carrier protein LolA [Candidatus Aphodousia faecipullorum]|nr:outer membrane lipoprotein carrier protein LolA [Candidatus Aphodousia faecipullorum]
MCAFARIFLALSLWLTFIGQAPASVLDSIIEQIPTAPLIRGQYTQTQKLVHVPQPFVTHGHFVFWRDSVFLWKTQDKIPTSTVYSEHSFKTYVHLRGQRIVSSSSPATSLENRVLWALFSKDFNSLELDFQILAHDGKEGWQLDFFPKTNLTRSIVKHIQIRGHEIPESMTMQNYSGDFTTLRFTNVELSSSSSSEEEAELANP